jgi:hypothetical protein
MGSLSKYSLRNLDCDIFVETGTGSGASLRHALLSRSFRRLFSVEIHEPSARRLIDAFSRHTEVSIYNSDSESALIDIFKRIKDSDKVFFFLDAHFPGEFSNQFSGYESCVADRTTLPLEHELALIKKYRPNCRDVIVVDDLRLYEEGPFEHGNLPSGFANIPDDMRDINFVAKLFPDRHVARDYRDEGYLFILPPGGSFAFTSLGLAEKVVRLGRKFIFL